MWKSRLLASTWKRIHYDHHQDPNHLEVLFGALHTTLPTIAVATLPIGWAIGTLLAGRRQPGLPRRGDGRPSRPASSPPASTNSATASSTSPTSPRTSGWPR
jgi:hypothetical protein